MPCAGGCTACCHGVFDVSPADAALIADATRRLSPEVRAPLVRRAEAQLARYAALAPEWGPPYDVEALGEDAFDALVAPLAAEPCPALDEAGRCVIYTHRPATCRMLGLGMASPELGVLDNECPIQEAHPEYRALSPAPFDLLSFERASFALELRATAAGRVSTTIAAAIAVNELSGTVPTDPA